MVIKFIKNCVLLFIIVNLSACKKIGKLKEFDLNYSEEIVIPANNTIINLPFNINSPETTTNTTEEYKNEGTEPKLVENVILSKLLFTIQTPASGNFNFLNSVEIYLSSPNNTEILVASKYNIPETGLTQLEMDVSTSNLKNYLQDETYKLRVKTTTDQTLTSDMTIRSDETFHVKARLRNIFKR